MLEKGSTDVHDVISSLRRLAGPDGERIIRRATAPVDEFKAVSAFLDEVVLPEHETATEATKNLDPKARGRRAALGDFSTDQRATVEELNDYFHFGHGTDLRADHEVLIR